MRRQSFGKNVVGPEAITPSRRKHRYWYEPFAVGPICWDGEAVLGAGNPGATILRVNRVFTGFHTFEFSPLAAAADSDAVIISPVLGSEGGYDWGGDQVLGDGFEVNFGGVKPTHPRVLLSGTDEGYFRIRLSVEDVSGLNLFVGFRGGATIQAVQAALESYTDVFGIQALGDSASAAAPVNLLHCLTGDATDAVTSVATASTIADATVYEFEVRIGGQAGGPAFGSAGGLTPRFLLNGVELLGSAAIANVLTARYWTPILRFTHVSDVGGQVKTWAAEGGLMDDRPEGLLA